MHKTFITILFAAASYGAFAQEAAQKEPAKPRATVTKGYYAIGDHAKKLPPPVVLYATGTVKEPARKGYYAIEAKERKAVVIDVPPSRPKATKGYYAIDSKPDSSRRKD